MTDEIADTVEVAAPVEVQAPAEVTEDDALGAMFDKLTADEPVAEEPEAVEPVDAEETPEVISAPAEVETPPDLPANIKAKWAAMPEDAREAVLSSHRDMSRKLADQGRVVQASKPIYDVLVQAAQDIPSMRDMTPAQIAQDVFAMARIQGDLNKDPVRTILGIAKQYGALDGIRQAIAGQQPDQGAAQNVQMAQELKALRAQVSQFADPTLIEQRVTQTLTTRDTERMVSDYAGQKEHWAAVEPMIPALIPIVQQRLGQGASAQDVLDAAYDMAIHANPDLRAKVTAPAVQQAAPDPARTAAQMKAKSVNVTSRPGTARVLTEDQALAAVWDKHRN
jgi:hypothetical protein